MTPKVAAALALVAAATTLLLAASVAGAETQPTAQALADGGAWLPYAPLPPARAGMCLVDTGVQLNPDTQAAVVYRTTLSGGTGEDTSPQAHGTVLTMMAAGVGWGMVGTAPGAIQIVSVGILKPGQTTFPFYAYADGIMSCLELRKTYNIRTINLSLGSNAIPSPEEMSQIENAVKQANDYDIAVVAAAGNDNGGSIEYPAADPAVISVAAADTATGALCSFSNFGPTLTITAPGCDLDGATIDGEPNYDYWQGSSEASVITAAALTALRAYDPELTQAEATKDLTRSEDNGQLDIAAAFRAAGLTATIAAGEAAEPRPTSNPTSPPAPTATPSSLSPPSPVSQQARPGLLTHPLPAPRATLAHAGRRLRLTLTARPVGAREEIRLFHRRPGARQRTLQTITSALSTLDFSATVLRIELRYIDPYDTARDSPWIALRPPPSQPTKPDRLP
jgi:hypothetical protein